MKFTPLGGTCQSSLSGINALKENRQIMSKAGGPHILICGPPPAPVTAVARAVMTVLFDVEQCIKKRRFLIISNGNHGSINKRFNSS